MTPCSMEAFQKIYAMTGAECREDDLRVGALDLMHGPQRREAADRRLLDSLGWMIWYTFVDHLTQPRYRPRY